MESNQHFREVSLACVQTSPSLRKHRESLPSRLSQLSYRSFKHHTAAGFYIHRHWQGSGSIAPEQLSVKFAEHKGRNFTDLNGLSKRTESQICSCHFLAILGWSVKVGSPIRFVARLHEWRKSRLLSLHKQVQVGLNLKWNANACMHRRDMLAREFNVLVSKILSERIKVSIKLSICFNWSCLKKTIICTNVVSFSFKQFVSFWNGRRVGCAASWLTRGG